MLYIIRKSDTGTILARTTSFNRVMETINDAVNIEIDVFDETEGHLENPIVYDSFNKREVDQEEPTHRNEGLYAPAYIIIGTILLSLLVVTIGV